MSFAAALVVGSALLACSDSPKVRECTLGTGTCECPPGDPQCGPKVLIYSDGYSASAVQVNSDAVGAAASLRGSSLSTQTAGEFVTAYSRDSSSDILVIDVSNSGNPSPWITYDWVNCGGRLIYNNWNYSAWEQALLGVTVSGGFNPARPLYSDPASPANFLAGFPSPLTVTAVSLPWGSFGIEPTPNPAASGFVAARYTSSAGTNAIAVTKNRRVIVNGFLPSDYQAVDNNGNGKPDMQELYANEMAYLLNQGPTGLTCSVVEAFDSGTWPRAPWVAKGGDFGSITAGCDHDGVGGFDDAANPSLTAWYARTDVTIGRAGQKFSMWFHTPTTFSASGSGELLGFGSTGTGTFALFASTWSSLFYILTVPDYGNSSSWAAVVPPNAQVYTASTWYRLEVEFGTPDVTGTPVTGRLHSADGVTVLNTLNATLSGFAPGGVSFLTYGATAGATCADTIKVY